MGYSRNSIQSSWSSLIRRHRPAPTSRYPESRKGMSAAKTRGFLQLLDLRIEELERSLRSGNEGIDGIDGIDAIEARTEIDAVRALRTTFLQILRNAEPEA